MNDSERVFTGIIEDLESSPLEGIIEGIDFKQALTEFIDNSKDSGATKVTIKRIKNAVGKEFIEIVDNGCGMSEMFVKDYVTHYNCHKANSNNTIGLRGCGSKAAAYRLVNFTDMKPNTQETVYIETCDGSPTIVYGEMKLCKTKQVSESVRVIGRDTNTVFGNRYTKFIIPLNIAVCFDKLNDYITISYPNNEMEIELIDTVDEKVINVKCIDRCLSKGIFDNEEIWEENEEAVNSIDGYKIVTPLAAYFLRYIYFPVGHVFKRAKSMSICLRNEGAEITNELNTRGNGVKHHNGGVFVLRGNRYINTGNNFLPVLGISTNYGGVGRFRTLIDANDDDVANLLGVKANKSEPIKSIGDDYDVLNPNRTQIAVGNGRVKDLLLSYLSDGKGVGVFDMLYIGYLDAKNYMEENIMASVLKNKKIKKEQPAELNISTVLTPSSITYMPKKEVVVETAKEMLPTLLMSWLREDGVKITKKQEKKAITKLKKYHAYAKSKF